MRGGATSGLGLAQDRFAEQVHVETKAVAAGASEVLGQGRIVGVDDEVTDQLSQAPARQRHHDARSDRGDERADPQQQAVGPTEEAGGRRTGDRRQLAGGHVRILRPRDAVDETHGKVETGRIADQRGELSGDGALGGGLLERRGRDPLLGECDRVVHQRRNVVGTCGRVGHHARSTLRGGRSNGTAPEGSTQFANAATEDVLIQGCQGTGAWVGGNRRNEWGCAG